MGTDTGSAVSPGAKERPLPDTFIRSIESERSAYFWWGLLAASTVLSVCCVWLWIGAPAILGPWDVIAMLGEGYRVTLGQVPSTDFHNPIGPLIYWLTALGMKIDSKPSPAAMVYGSVIFAAVLAPLTWVVARRRLPAAYAAVVTVFLAVVVMTPRALGYSYAETTFAMIYNRFGWAMYSIVLLICLFPTFRLTTKAACFSRGVLIGALLALLLLCKITFFLSGAVAVLVGVVLAYLPRRIVLGLGMFLGFGAVVGSVAIGLNFRLSDYLFDVLGASQAQVGQQRLAELVRGLMDNLPVEILSAAAVFLLILIVRRLGTSRVDLLRAVAAISFVIGSSVAISAGNATEHSELPALVVVPAIAYAAIQRDAVLGKWRVGWPLRYKRGVNLTGGQVVTVSATVLLLATTGLTFGKEALQTEKSIALRSYVADAPSSQRVDAPAVSDFVVPMNDDYETAYRDARDVPMMISNGLDLLRKHISVGDHVFTLGYTDPFSMALGLDPVRGGQEWWDAGYDFDADVHPSASEAINSAEWIITPTLKPGQGCCQKTVDLLGEIYGPYIGEHYRQVDRNGDWILFSLVS